MSDPYSFKDPYSQGGSHANDPYSRGGHDPYNKGSMLNRRDTLLNDDPYKHNDPYAQRDTYKHNDPYRFHDPYKANNPYATKSTPTERERFSFFWFWIKREIQLLFNAEAGSQEQDLIYPIEEDFIKLRIATKFFVRNIISFFFVLFGFWASFAILAQIGSKYGQLKFVFSILYFFLLLYLLFLPTHQIVSSFEYTIYRNVKEFYRRVASLFSSYRNSIIFAMFLNVALGAIIAYEPSWLHFILKKDNIILEFFKTENVKSAYNLLAGIIIFTFILYIFFYKVIFNIAEKNRKEHIKSNKKRKSEFYKYTSTLDDE
jgi:hypothetical protein